MTQEPHHTVLVLNSGSSSVKYQVIAFPSEHVIDKVQRDRVGIDGADFADHTAAIADIVASLPPDVSIDIVGHRVVHGGSRFTQPTVIDDEVIAGIEDVSSLAPLHNPANLDGIRAVTEAMPDVAQVAVFDTAYLSTLSPAAWDYALPRELVEHYGIRKYGFHGTSHQFVTDTVLQQLPTRKDPYRIVSLHLGNGSSVTASIGGVAIDTSMGMTPLAGLVMGTRSGDIDPSVAVFLQSHANYTPDQVDDLLNRRSGLLGLSGHSDMRDLFARANDGYDQARHAIDVWVWRVRHYLGAYIAQLGGIDAIVFTGGIGENQADLRAEVLAGLEFFGIAVDPDRNHSTDTGNRQISPDPTPVSVWVIPTNEELQIARLSARCVGG